MSNLRSPRGRPVSIALSMVILLLAGCINTVWKTEIRQQELPSPTESDSTIIYSPMKVHLLDGSTVIFSAGGVVSGTRIRGQGQSYALLSDVAVPRSEIPLDSVAGMETYTGKVLGGSSFFVSLAATALGAFATAALAVAIFGSCPTIYADPGTGMALQAEGFSYAIAPLLEHRDVDPLHLRPDADGIVRLELRNEALETHFINQIELLSVRHPVGVRVMPDQTGRPVSVVGFGALTGATDRAGRDVTRTLAVADGDLFASAASVVGGARAGDLEDWIDLEVSGLPTGDSIAVILRLRNSLLNTILLYEGLLGGRDALDFLSNGLEDIASAVDLSRWYVRTMGMRAFVDGVAPPTLNPELGHARLGDVGPIAFREVALVLPRPVKDTATTRIRLRFVADNWRIDQILVGGSISRPVASALPVAQVIIPEPARGKGPILDPDAVKALATPDGQYLETHPGQRMTLVFGPDAAPPATTDSTVSHLIAWQGWYREWVRGAWLAQPQRTVPFVPGDEAVLTALRRWTERKESFEREFYASKIPVR